MVRKVTSEDHDWFMNADLSQYAEEEYVIIIDKKVVAHAKENLKQVLREIIAKNKGKMPLVAKVPSKNALIL